MILPTFGIKEEKKMQLSGFGGLDLREKPGKNSLSAMENLSPKGYPAAIPRKARKKVLELSGITNLFVPEETGTPMTAFTGVRNRGFYYQGRRIDGQVLKEGKKTIVDFNGKICIFPDKVYYGYLPDPDTGEVKDCLLKMETTILASGVRFYSSYQELTGTYTAYLQKTDAGFNLFSPGDSIVISGASKSQNNVVPVEGKKDFASSDAIVSAVVEKATRDRLDLLLFTKSGKFASFENTTESEEITVSAHIPDMNHICVHNNRLWGTSQNGEYIYASKLGDCMNFHSFQGLSDDSWYGYVGTPGEFTGICSYRSGVVAFKRNCIHHIYGDAPQNFSMPKQIMGGCKDGESIRELGGVLYYLSDTGFCGYQGGEPYPISPALGENRYQSAISGTDQQYYYASAYQKDGSCDLLVFDPMLGAWYREDHTPFLGFAFYGGVFYGATEGALFAFGEGAEPVNWSMTTQNISYQTITHKGVSALWLRLEKDGSAQVNVEISYDKGAFLPCGTLTIGESFGVRRIPVRFRKCDSFRIRISGTGSVVIHDLELETYQGGRNYGL